MTGCQKCGAKAPLYLCAQCTTWLRHQALGMPTLVDYLTDAALGMTRMSSDPAPMGKSFESRTPSLDSRASLLATEIEQTVGQWAGRLARQHGLTVSLPTNWWRVPEEYRYTTRDHATFLGAHVALLAKDQDVGELCAALRNYSKRGIDLINRREPDQFCGPCPREITDHRRCVDKAGVNTCGFRPHQCATSLMARAKALEVTCPRCDSVHDVAKLVTRLLAHADDFRATIPELHRIMRMLNESVGLSTLYRWAEPPSSKRRGSGQLKPCGYVRDDNGRVGVTKHSEKDKPLYRVSDARRRREQNERAKRERKRVK